MVANMEVPAVGDERQRHAGDRHDAQGHPDVLERLEREPADDAGGHQGAEQVLGPDRDPHAAPQHHAEQHDEQAGPDEAELLARDGEHEVGLLLRDELAVRLRAVEQPLAEPSAGADRDPCLLDVVAGALRVAGWGRRTPRTGRAGTASAHRACTAANAPNAPMAISAAIHRVGVFGDREDAEDDDADDDGRAEVGLQHDQRDRHQRHAQRQRDVGRAVVRPRRRGVSASSIGSATHSATLANSDGWIEKPAGQQDPRVRPVDGRADRATAPRSGRGPTHVDDGRVRAQRPVVEQRGHRRRGSARA